MNKKTVFLLQGTKEQNEELKMMIEENGNYEVCGYAEDGISAIPAIQDKKPNVVITEIVLAGYDGLNLISKLKELGLPTKIIVLSALTSEGIVAECSKLGVDYFMAKPLNKQYLIERLDKFFNEEQTDIKQPLTNVYRMTVEEKVSKIFINVGIPPHVKGYAFLREGVLMAIDNPDIINNITKKLYPQIGKKYQTTASKVERAIRHAIEVAWNRGRIDSINAILGVRAYVGAEKPTNGEFIALVADKMLLEKA
jgi:two-component system response regulator (stage 0 sporulation protein A)